MIGIYKITSPNQRIYIGQAVSLEKRKKSYDKLRCKGQPRLYASLVKYGFSEHLFEIIEQCVVEELNTRERHWQDFYDVLSEKGLNCKLTKTEDTSGHTSQEVRTKISQSMIKRGHKPPNRGGVIGYWKDKVRTQECRDSISVALLGIKREPKSEEWKESHSQTMKGRIPWNKGIKYTQKVKRAGKHVVNTQTGATYSSITEASEKEGISRDVVIYSCNKLKGRFRYIN